MDNLAASEWKGKEWVEIHENSICKRQHKEAAEKKYHISESKRWRVQHNGEFNCNFIPKIRIL